MGLERRGPFPWAEVAAALVAAAGCLAFAYGLNAVMERGTDVSPDKNPLVVSPSYAPATLRLALGCAAGALVLGSLLGLWSAGCVALSLLCGALYSAVVRAKRVPVLGLLCNAGIFLPLALLLRSGRGGDAWALELALFAALLTQNQLVHELADEAEDRAAGARTTAQLLGPRGTRVVAALVGFAGLFPIDGERPERVLIALATCASCALVAVGRAPARARRAHRYAAMTGGAALHGVSWWLP